MFARLRRQVAFRWFKRLHRFKRNSVPDQRLKQSHLPAYRWSTETGAVEFEPLLADPGALAGEGGGDGEHTLTRFWRRSGGDADEIVMFFIDITAAEAVAQIHRCAWR